MFAISTHHMPSISSYAQAAQFFARTPKPRSAFWHDHMRPLESTSQRHKRIVKEGDAYALYLYQRPVVTYYPDGTVTIQRYASQSTAAFVCRVSPFRASLRNGSMFVYNAAGAWTGSELVFRSLSDKPTGFEPQTVRRLDKVKAAEARKRVAEVVQVLRAAAAIPFAWEELECKRTFVPFARLALEPYLDGKAAVDDVVHAVMGRREGLQVVLKRLYTALYSVCDCYYRETLPDGVIAPR